MSRRKEVSVARELTLSEQMVLLFEYGEGRGLATSYRAIAEATGENATNIRKMHLGENLNPGIKSILALADYFGVRLDYFGCATREACQNYLAGAKPTQLEQDIAKRVDGLSETALEAIATMLDYVRKAEQLPPSKPR